MKKVWFILWIGLMLPILYACTSEDDVMAEVLEMIPLKIESDLTLPSTYEDYNLSWFLNGEQIAETLPLKYTFKTDLDTLEVHLTKGFKTIKGEKDISYKVSPIVTDLKIQTQYSQNITSKETYVNGTVTLDSATDTFDQTNLSMQIKGRGNSSWNYPKKPYRIKFNNRQSLLGMKPAKDYVLLAEYNDKSLIRNYLAHYMSTYLNLDYTLETRFVNVYLNNNYQGIYLLTEQVEVDKERLNIDESNVADGGFLIELESNDRIWQEGTENKHWVKVAGYNYVIKSPDMDALTPSEIQGKVTYIKNTLNALVDSFGDNTYENHIDVDQFIDYFILSELFKQVDVGYSSVYIHKDKGELLKMGPIWDFDISSGNGDYFDYHPEGHWVDYNPWFREIIQQPYFEYAFITRYIEISENYVPLLIQELDFVSTLLSETANQNFNKWQILNYYVWPNPPEMVEANTYHKQIQYLRNYLITRDAWLKSNLSTIGFR